jgi:hypothetical protein
MGINICHNDPTVIWNGCTELVKWVLADSRAMRRQRVDRSPPYRALKDLNRYTGREKTEWVKRMAARKRKTHVFCRICAMTTCTACRPTSGTQKRSRTRRRLNRRAVCSESCMHGSGEGRRKSTMSETIRQLAGGLSYHRNIPPAIWQLEQSGGQVRVKW